MRIELTDREQTVSVRGEYLIGPTLAWRAFGKALGVPVHDPMDAIDAGIMYGQIAGRYFDLEEAEGDHFLSLGHVGCWDGGAMRSLSPRVIYVSYSVAPDGSFVDFHGWHKPKKASRIIPHGPDGNGPFLTKDGLSPMSRLVWIMQRRIAAGLNLPQLQFDP